MAYIYDAVKSLGFGVRNDVKASGNGSDAGVRGLVGTIQTAKAGTSIFAQVKKYDTAAKIANNTANYVSKAVNPLLCVAGVARIAASDDRPSAAIEESLAMGSMFGMESIMKKQFKAGSTLADTSVVKNGVQKFTNLCQNTKILKNFKTGTLGSIITGALFIAGSISAYTIGQKAGQIIADNTTRKKYHFLNSPINA